MITEGGWDDSACEDIGKQCNGSHGRVGSQFPKQNSPTYFRVIETNTTPLEGAPHPHPSPALS